MANKARRGGAGSSPAPAPDDVVKAIVESGSGAYLLLGENGIDQEDVIDRCVEALTKPESRAFNYDNLDADDPDTSAEAVASAVRSYPMLDSVRVAVVRNLHTRLVTAERNGQRALFEQARMAYNDAGRQYHEILLFLVYLL